MSVNSTVASTRSGRRHWWTPVRNSSIASRISLGVADPEECASPGNSTNFAPGIRAAKSRPASTLDVRIAGAMQDKGRRLNRRQDLADVELRVHPLRAIAALGSALRRKLVARRTPTAVRSARRERGQGPFRARPSFARLCEVLLAVFRLRPHG